MLRTPKTATLVTAQTLAANDGTGDVQNGTAANIEGFGLITLTGTVNNASDNASVHIFTSDAATAPTASSTCAYMLDPNKVDGTALIPQFLVNDVTSYTIRVCAKWILCYVEASSTSSTTTLTLTLKGHATST